MPRLQLFACVLSVLLAFSCSSTPDAPGDRGSALLVTLHDYKNGSRFELASESHTDRVDYYSSERQDAIRKIQTDEVMGAFVAELDKQRFGEYARTGPAPRIGSADSAREALRWGLELVGPAGKLHWLVGKGSTPTDWEDFQSCRSMFLQLYNATMSYQTVTNSKGGQFFDEKARSASGKPQGR